MKRLTSTLLSLCLVLMASAESISKQAALYTAQAYLLAKGKTVSNAQSPAKAARRAAQTAESDDAYYYVFNAGGDGGYVIVSGDDRVDPILGYVEHGSFDPENIPENMREYLDSFAEEIQYIIDNDLQPTSPQLKRRSKVSAAKHSVPELLTSRWNQGMPYNLTLPLYYKGDGSQARPATGCIATAWAQVVGFHKYPDKIKVAIPSHSKTFKLDDGTEKTVNYPAIPKNTPIDWENMRDTYSCSESHAHTAQDTAVADLMRYCGYAVKMSYGASSSASYRYTEFIKYFGFDDSAYRIARDDYDIDGWADAIYNELAEGYPMPVAGTKIGGAHAFVIDGFDGDNLFHVNWGWGGSGNGWFLLGILNRWNRGNGAIMHLRRPDNVRAETHLNIKDVSVTGTSVKATFENNTGASGSYHYAVLKLEEDGTYSVVGTQQSITNLANDDSQTKVVNIKDKLTEGTHKLFPANKMLRSTTWYTWGNPRDRYIEAVVDAEGNTTLTLISPVYDISIAAIEFPRLRIVGQEQEIDVTFRNDGDEFYHDVHLFVSKTEEKVYTDYLFRVAAHKGETVTYPFYYTPEETGTYNLWFCTGKDGSGEIGRGTMEIMTEDEAQASRANLAITHTVVNGSNNTAYGKRLYGKASVKNNGATDFHGSIELQLWHQNKSSSSAVSGPGKSFSLDIPAGRTVSFDYEFESLSDTYYYRIKALYNEQSGNLSGGGLWDVKIDMQPGLVNWRNDGTVTGRAYSSAVSTLSSVCGVYANCSKINRMSPNRNPNTIYAFASEMELPAGLDTCNAVSGNHASHINMVSDQPYYIPVSFTADSASFTYTFPETEDGTGWHAFTMPFKADSIFVDDIPVSLNDTLGHFWIYEFAAQADNGDIIFAPATELRAETPYIIAADVFMAGHSVVFRAQNTSFYKTGSNKMVVSTPGYLFHGNTFAPKLKDCYMLNEGGTAFEYVSTAKALSALTPYFSTRLSEEQRLPSIVLPDIPVCKNPDGISLTPALYRGNDVIYNIIGQRLREQTRGINIVNGKKIYKK